MNVDVGVDIVDVEERSHVILYVAGAEGDRGVQEDWQHLTSRLSGEPRASARSSVSGGAPGDVQPLGAGFPERIFGPGAQGIEILICKRMYSHCLSDTGEQGPAKKAIIASFLLMNTSV